MAAKKKSKKVTKSKRTAGKKSTRAKRVPKKRAAAKKTAAKKKSAANSRKALATRRSAKKHTVRRGTSEQNAAVDLERLQSRSGLQSGDLQGVRDVESANSESVEELLEEGNAFEAGIVAGIEKAEDDIEKEIRTHEVPEDDVPEEYLDKD